MAELNNITSSDIRVFPTTQRENTDPSAKFTTEYNLTSLLNKLLDRKAFVITAQEYLKINNGILETLEFNIMGYFFTLQNLDINSLLEENKDGYINATIRILEQDYMSDQNSSNASKFNNWWQLKGSDLNDKYDGIYFESVQSPTYIPMAEYISGSDLGISEPQSLLTAENGNLVSYTFTILQYNKSGDVWIPADSRIKFQTNKDGTQHSLAIDDGELVPSTSSSTTFNMKRPPTLEDKEAFDGLALNASNLTLFEGELFRLEYEYDNIGDIIFKSSDTNIATVSSNGLVRGINKGTCLIVASYKSINAVCNVVVK